MECLLRNGSAFGGTLQIHLSHEPMQVIGMHAQEFSGFGIVPLGLLERLENELLLGIADGLVVFCDGDRSQRLALQHGLGQIFRQHQFG